MVRERGRQRRDRRARRRARRHPARHGLGLRAHVRHPTRSRPRRRHRATGSSPRDRCMSSAIERGRDVEARAHANVASAGISGAIAQRANESSKALGGKVSYYWATLAVFFGWQAGEMRVTVGDETRTGRMIDAMICNGRFLGGGMMMCPDAMPDDGMFDVLLDRRRDEARPGLRAPEDLQGKAPTAPAPRAPPRQRRHGRRRRAASHRARRRAAGNHPARFEIVPRALRLRVPA